MFCADISRGIDLYEETRRFEIKTIRKTLEKKNGKQVRTAHLFGLNNTTLNAKIKHYGIESARRLVRRRSKIRRLAPAKTNDGEQRFYSSFNRQLFQIVKLLTRKKAFRGVIKYIGICILISIIFSGLVYFSTAATQPPEKTLGWQLILTWQAIVYGWAILFPFIQLFVRKFPFERQNWLRASMTYSAAVFLFVLAHTIIYAAFYEVIHETCFQTENAAERIQFLFLKNWTLDTATFGLILGSIFAYDYYRRFQEEQMNSAELKTELANSQLHALKMQLHPHFLFNTLNSISALIHEDPRAADKMVARLGDFLRLTLDNSGEQEVPLKKEINFLNRYLEIESVRFEDRLTIETEIAPETLAACVPNLILQPIIENAIRHGISQQTEAGRISVNTRREDGKLIIQIEDNGPGLNSAVVTGNNGKGGIGLANTRARLAHLYGEHHSLLISNIESGGVRVTMEIPFKVSETETAEAKIANRNEKVTVN